MSCPLEASDWAETLNLNDFRDFAPVPTTGEIEQNLCTTFPGNSAGLNFTTKFDLFQGFIFLQQIEKSPRLRVGFSQ